MNSKEIWSECPYSFQKKWKGKFDSTLYVGQLNEPLKRTILNGNITYKRLSSKILYSLNIPANSFFLRERPVC